MEPQCVQYKYLHQNPRKCTIQEHEDQDVTCVCLHKNCLHPSRFLCINCLIEDHNDHSQAALNIKDVELKTPKILANWPINKRNPGKFSKILSSNIKEENIIEQINQFFFHFREQIINEINTLQKEILVRANELQYDIINLEKKVEQSLDLQKLKDIFIDFKDETLSHQEASIKIEQFILELDYENKQKEFFLEYDCIQADSLKSTDLIYMSKNRIQFLDNDQKFNGSCRLVCYSDSFHRNQFVKLRLRITYGYNSRGYKYGQKVNYQNYRIPIGIVIEGDQNSGCNWANSGNQVDIGPRLESKGKIKVSKKVKSFSELFWQENEMVLNVEIFIKENIFKIYDDQEQCYIENLELLEDAENWRFIISNHAYYTPIFEIIGILIQ